MLTRQRPGFFPLVGLVTTAFLAVAIFIGTALVSNPNIKFDLRNFAKTVDDENAKAAKTECTAKGWKWLTKDNRCQKPEVGKKEKELPTETCLTNPDNNGSGVCTKEACDSLDPPLVLGNGSCNFGHCCYSGTPKTPQVCTDTCVESSSCPEDQTPVDAVCTSGVCCKPKETSQTPDNGATVNADTGIAGSIYNPGSPCVRECVAQGRPRSVCEPICASTNDSGSTPHNASPPKPTTISVGADCIQTCLNNDKTATPYSCASQCHVDTSRPKTTTIAKAKESQCSTDKIKTCTKGCQPTADGIGICVEDLAGGPTPTTGQTVGAACIQNCIINIHPNQYYQCASECGVQAVRTAETAAATPVVAQATPVETKSEKAPDLVSNGNPCDKNENCLSGLCYNSVCLDPEDTVTDRMYHGMVYYAQTDAQWADETPPNENAGTNCNKKFYQVGCGPTVAASLVSTYTHKDIDPYEMASQYADGNSCGLTSFQENMDQLEQYGFETQQYRGSLYRLGNYIRQEDSFASAPPSTTTQTTTQTPVDNVAWLEGDFTADGETFGHHSLIVAAEENSLGETVRFTLNDPYLGPNVECNNVDGLSFDCVTEDQKTVRVENIGIIIIDPSQVAPL